MSLFSKVGTFLHTVEQDIEKLWGKAPGFTTVALTGLTFVGPVLETVVTIEAGAAAGSALTSGINKVETDLMAAKGLLNTIGATPSVKALITGSVTDLQDLLTLGSIKDSKSVANVQLVLNELNAIVEAFPATPATPDSSAS